MQSQGIGLLSQIEPDRARSSQMCSTTESQSVPVSVCVDAVIYPIARAFALPGRGAASAALHRLVRPMRSALTLTWPPTQPVLTFAAATSLPAGEWACQKAAPQGIDGPEPAQQTC